MKIQHLIPILFLAIGIALLSGCATSYISPSGQADTDVIAIGDWSKPVSDGKGNFTYTLRGRLLVYAPYISNVKSETNYGQWYPHSRVYLELQQIKPEHACKNRSKSIMIPVSTFILQKNEMAFSNFKRMPVVSSPMLSN